MALKRARKRAPGAGRKSKGGLTGKVETFTTRITPDTRRALDRAAGMSGRSVSSEAEHLLRLSLQRPSGARHNQALARVVALLAERIEGETQKDWRYDPFTGQALRYAVEALLFHFTMTADAAPAVPPAVDQAAARMPAEFAERHRKPAGLGHQNAYALITEIEQAPMPAEPTKMIDEWTPWGLPGFPPVPPDRFGLLRLDLIEKTGK